MIRRALTNTGWLMGARGVNAVLSLGYLALATRSLGLEGFGFEVAQTYDEAEFLEKIMHLPGQENGPNLMLVAYKDGRDVTVGAGIKVAVLHSPEGHEIELVQLPG
jgi:hypothetical protein